MQKDTKPRKNIYDAVRAMAIKWTAANNKCTEQWVRQIVNDPTLIKGRAEEIRADFDKKYAELKAVL